MRITLPMPMLLIFAVLLTLKLTDVIDWSWWWVTAPLWGGMAISVVFVTLALLVTVFAMGLALLAGKGRL